MVKIRATLNSLLMRAAPSENREDMVESLNTMDHRNSRAEWPRACKKTVES